MRTVPRTGGYGEAALVEGSVEFDVRDAALLRAIDRTGSVAQASSELGRSRARALNRIETLEAAFGSLVERRRGGSDGGGSRLTEDATTLLNRYERLQVALDATAQVPETVLCGTVTAVDGALASVETAVGPIRGLHDGVEQGQQVQVRVGADAITVLDEAVEPDPDSTSARNRLSGTVSDVERGSAVVTIGVDVAGPTFQALLTADSEQRLELRENCEVTLTWKATATRIVRERG